jgi:hypothetical protein
VILDKKKLLDPRDRSRWGVEDTSIMMLPFWVFMPCRLVGRCNVSEKHMVSIFRVELTMLVSGGIEKGLKEGKTSALKVEIVCISETLASTYESTQLQNPEEQYHHPHRRENLKSDTGITLHN